MNKQIILILFFYFAFGVNLIKAQILEGIFFFEELFYLLIEEPSHPHWKETTFASYPYDYPNAGLFLPVDLLGDKSRAQAMLHLHSSERNVIGAYAQIKYTPISLFSIDANYLRLGAKKSLDIESIHYSSVSFLYNRYRLSKFHAWWGVGATYWKEGMDEEGSVNFVIGFTYYFKEPLSLDTDVYIFEANDRATTFWKSKIQVHLNRYVLYGGAQGINLENDYLFSWILGGGIFF